MRILRASDSNFGFCYETPPARQNEWLLTPFGHVFPRESGPTDNGQKMDMTRQNGSPHIARVDSGHERGQQTLLAAVSEPTGTVLKPFLAPAGPGLLRPIRARGRPMRAEPTHFGAKGDP